MSRWNLSDAAFQLLATGEYALVMAKSQENRLAFAAWLLFFRDRGRFPRDDSDLELVDPNPKIILRGSQRKQYWRNDFLIFSPYL